jgi:hypothetical protein
LQVEPSDQRLNCSWAQSADAVRSIPAIAYAVFPLIFRCPR